MALPETAGKLEQNLQNQLDRLIEQLDDIEASRGEMDEAEYKEFKEDTLEQLEEFQASLQRMNSGDISLVDRMTELQIATKRVIAQASKAPEILEMFSKKEPQLVRDQIKELDRDYRVGKLTQDLFLSQKLERMRALEKLGQAFTQDEMEFLQNYSAQSLQNFANAKKEVNKETVHNIKK